jgi:hypothetical protein
MQTSDWINLATAVGAAVTAVFTGLTYLVSPHATKLSEPPLQYFTSKKSHYRSINLSIDDQQRKYFIAAISISRPRAARVSLPKPSIYDPVTSLVKEEGPSEWKRQILFDAGLTKASVFVDPAGAKLVVLSVSVALRAFPKIVSRRAIRIKIKDRITVKRTATTSIHAENVIRGAFSFGLYQALGEPSRSSDGLVSAAHPASAAS